MLVGSYDVNVYCQMISGTCTDHHHTNMHAMQCDAILGVHVWCVVFGDVIMIQLFPPPVSGASGAGKSFTADQLLVKMFQTAHRTDWLQDLRKVQHPSSFLSPSLPLSLFPFPLSPPSSFPLLPTSLTLSPSFPLPTFLSPSSLSPSSLSPSSLCPQDEEEEIRLEVDVLRKVPILLISS